MHLLLMLSVNAAPLCVYKTLALTFVLVFPSLTTHADIVLGQSFVQRYVRSIWLQRHALQLQDCRLRKRRFGLLEPEPAVSMASSIPPSTERFIRT